LGQPREILRGPTRKSSDLFVPDVVLSAILFIPPSHFLVAERVFHLSSQTQHIENREDTNGHHERRSVDFVLRSVAERLFEGGVGFGRRHDDRRRQRQPEQFLLQPRQVRDAGCPAVQVASAFRYFSSCWGAGSSRLPVGRLRGDPAFPCGCE